MKMLTIPVYNTAGKEIDTAKLDANVFDNTVNTAAIYQVINAYRANQRKGLASTKTRGEVSGGGRKPWRQKGTGRARAGSIRSPLWRHGGVVFGPHPRDFSSALPKKLKNLALRSALNEKVKENNFIVLENFKIEKPKTKETFKILSNLKINPVRTKTSERTSNGINPKKGQGHLSALLLLDKIDRNLRLAARNIDFLNINLAKDTNAYEVLAYSKIIVTKNALEQLIERLRE